MKIKTRNSWGFPEEIYWPAEFTEHKGHLSKDAAKSFTERHGWEYAVKKRQTPLLKIKTYAENFKWNGLLEKQ
ncbi:hypothetical protein AgCh_029388 [Apium graveolens]